MLSKMLTAFVRSGYLKVIDADGVVHEFGEKGSGPFVSVRLHDRSLHTKIPLNPELRTAEAYMDGTLSFEDGSGLDDLLRLYGHNETALYEFGWLKIGTAVSQFLRRFQQFNPKGRAGANAQHHYDLNEEFYRLFLDEDMVYSCAYWLDPARESLEQAQINKFRHIASKLQLEPGMRVVDIGSGWGSLAIYLARQFNVHVTGVNVAKEQLAASRRRAREAGLDNLVTFIEQDYRDIEGPFDRVVSVGMMEHVGVGYFDTYFAKIRDILTPEGLAMIHAIGRMGPPGTTGPFIRKYIFPGGYVPALSEVFGSTERTGLWVGDTEILRVHYADTIHEWLKRFRGAREQVLKMYDERFFRMWEFYLVAVETGFRYGQTMVYQLLLSKSRDAIPLTRDYITDGDREAAAGPSLREVPRTASTG